LIVMAYQGKLFRFVNVFSYGFWFKTGFHLQVDISHPKD
jgi:hypothetical protein